MAEEKHRKQRKEMSKLNVMSYEILLIQTYEKKKFVLHIPKRPFLLGSRILVSFHIKRISSYLSLSGKLLSTQSIISSFYFSTAYSFPI